MVRGDITISTEGEKRFSSSKVRGVDGMPGLWYLQTDMDRRWAGLPGCGVGLHGELVFF